MLLWLFIAALILPYIVTWSRGGFFPLTRFSLSDVDLIPWIDEVDRNAGMLSEHIGYSESRDAEASDWEYLFTLKNGTPEAVFSHLQIRCLERIKKEGWRITETQTARESFSFVFSNGFSRYRLYVWNVPLTQNDRNFADDGGKQGMRVKVLIIGYTTR